MSDLPINGYIRQVPDGPYYPVKLEWVPRVGELIELLSFHDQVEGIPPKICYEVVQVLHSIHDIAKHVPQSHKGAHYVTIFVRLSASALFPDTEGPTTIPGPTPGQIPGNSRN